MGESRSKLRRAAVLVAIGMAATAVTLFLLVGRSPSPNDANGGGRPVTSSSSGTDGMTATPRSGGSAPSSVAGEHPEDVPSLRLPALPDTSAPDVYATAVAEVLFGMDHAVYDAGDYESLSPRHCGTRSPQTTGRVS